MEKKLSWLIVLATVALVIYLSFSRPPQTETKITNLNNQPNSTTTTTMQATLKTNYGDMVVELWPDQAPKTVENFVKLARSGFYDGTLFHRVIPNFMIQGGDPLTKSEPTNWNIHGTGGPGYQFADEINPTSVKLVRGVLAMANSGPNTNGSQFFIITAPATDWLDGKHTPFGKVISGMEVVDKISLAKANENNHPLEDVILQKVELN